jgi:RecB family exonuclease
MGDSFWLIFWIAVVGYILWRILKWWSHDSKLKQNKYSKRVPPSPREGSHTNTTNVSRIQPKILKQKAWEISPDELFKKEYVSFTRIKTFSTCPRMFELIYLYRYEDKSGRAAQVGILVHEILRLYTVHHKENFSSQLKTRDAPEELLSLYDLAKTSVELTYSIPKSELKPYIDNFIYLNRKNIYKVESIEYECNTTINEYSLKCIIDRVDTGIGNNLNCSIIDYKTGKPQNVTKNQLNTYAYALSQYEMIPNQLSIQFLKNGTTTTWEYTSMVHSQTEKWLLENIQKINNTQDFKRISSRLCDYCGVSEYCDMVP